MSSQPEQRDRKTRGAGRAAVAGRTSRTQRLPGRAHGAGAAHRVAARLDFEDPRPLFVGVFFAVVDDLEPNPALAARPVVPTAGGARASISRRPAHTAVEAAKIWWLGVHL